MNRVNCTIVLIIIFLASNYLFAGDSINLFKPTKKNLHEKLGISHQDWIEIHSLIEAKNNYDLIYIEKQAHGYIGAWMSKKAEGKSTHGPVFFYNKHNDKWYELEEMSSWKK
ncbi:MAG: hypothetical protein ACQ9MH_24400 [Nitrospinales bacterium]